MKVLITGIAGFIGFHLAKKLLENDIEVIGVDNFNDYYDVNLKRSRINKLKEIKTNSNLILKEIDITKFDYLKKVFDENEPDNIVHLAAQAGVRYSLINPFSYIQNNITGFINILECCRKSNSELNQLIYASSSSVYGGNKKLPFSEQDNVDHPVSLYAASKKSNELMAHTYSHLYNLPTTGLRFFTVYGPWGRPDMALFLFTKAILEGKEIKVFNYGDMMRDFTYVDDIVESIYKLLFKKAISNKLFDYQNPDPSSSWAPYKVFNIGNSSPISLMKYIEAIEDALNIKAKKVFLPIQPGDVPSTSANTNSLQNYIQFKPKTPVSLGVKKFIEWYKIFYKL